MCYGGKTNEEVAISVVGETGAWGIVRADQW